MAGGCGVGHPPVSPATLATGATRWTPPANASLPSSKSRRRARSTVSAGTSPPSPKPRPTACGSVSRTWMPAVSLTPPRISMPMSRVASQPIPGWSRPTTSAAQDSVAALSAVSPLEKCWPALSSSCHSTRVTACGPPSTTTVPSTASTGGSFIARTTTGRRGRRLWRSPR